MNTPTPWRVACVLAGSVLMLAGPAVLPAAAQAPPPAPGVSNLDTNNDKTNDLTIRRIDTDGDKVTDQVHIDNDNDGVVDPGERVFDNVTGYMVIGGGGGFTITIVVDTGTEKVKTVLEPFDKNGDGDCSDDDEMIQQNSMPDSAALLQLNLLGQPIVAQLQGTSQFAANLNRIVPVSGLDTIPTEIVALSLTGGPQPITVRLNQFQPSPGLLVENVNAIPGNLDGRQLARDGTVDSFFDVFVVIELSELPPRRLIHTTPLRMQSLDGIYPPAPLQPYFLASPVQLFDAATMLPVGTLDRFDWTPHVAPRAQCDCEKVTIKPVVETEKGKPLVVTSPEAIGMVNGDDDKVFDITIVVDWFVTIKCNNAGTEGCEANFVPTASSLGWMIDGKKSAPTGPDSHEGAGPAGRVVCVGKCGKEVDLDLMRTTYKVSVKKGAGGRITSSVSGTITLVMSPTDCEGDPWTMVLVYEADVKKDEDRIDARLSNWDGDKKINAADKNPLDPTKN